MNTGLSSISTLVELLQWRAKYSPEKVAFIIDDRSYTYKWLWDSCRRFATQLIAEEVQRNDRILLLAPNSATFFIAFYGSIFSGAIVVPVFPNAGTGRCEQLLELSGARHIILPKDISKKRKSAFEEWAIVKEVGMHWVSVSVQEEIADDFPDISRDDIAFIQYTSGSTDFPKGVPLSHHNLLINVRQMVKAMRITSSDTFVSWLPVYHDMGLILNTMAPFYTGAGLVLLAEGLHRVHSWLKAIENYRGTFISAPDIAYRLCVKSIRHPEEYDLSSLRVALNASERIQLSTYQMFEMTFDLKNIMVSGYGLAEATVGVTMHPPGVPPEVDAEGYVASGKALKGIEIKIQSKDKSEVGEILVKSEGLMKGYFNKRDGVQPFDKEGFLHTGDIGYVNQNGHLFVLARKKNCIKHAGHTIYPDDVEQVVKSVDNIRQVMAIGLETRPGGGENLFVFAETRIFRDQANEMYHSTIIDIVQKIKEYFGIRPGRVFLVKPKTLPRTPNGKLQHAKLKNMFQNDYDRFSESILYPRS
jgi:acyl-CoA synthetase (AMP-forming)/AMP-acid ligase II